MIIGPNPPQVIANATRAPKNPWAKKRATRNLRKKLRLTFAPGISPFRDFVMDIPVSEFCF